MKCPKEKKEQQQALISQVLSSGQRLIKLIQIQKEKKQ